MREREQAIYQKHPHLFGENFINWGGMEINDGWLPILEQVCDDVTSYPIRFTQIKEKFAGLRLYYDWHMEKPCSEADVKAVDAIIDKAEVLAEQTCENCGCPGSLRKGSWLVTLCDNCDNEGLPRKLV